MSMSAIPKTYKRTMYVATGTHIYDGRQGRCEETTRNEAIRFAEQYFPNGYRLFRVVTTELDTTEGREA